MFQVISTLFIQSGNTLNLNNRNLITVAQNEQKQLLKADTSLNKLNYFSTSETIAPRVETNQELFYVEEKTDLGYAIFRLNKRPVNSLNLEFLTALNIQLDKFEQNKRINGIILTSNVSNIFSAGLDIMEMYNPKPDRLRQFWSALQEFWIKLYGSNKVYIAAINVLYLKELI